MLLLLALAPLGKSSAGVGDIPEGDVDKCIAARLKPPPEHVKDENELVVTLHVLDRCEQHVQVTLTQRGATAAVEAAAVVAPFDSVAEQLAKLRELAPVQPLDELCEDVILAPLTIDPELKDELRSHIGELRRIETSPILEPEYFLHGMTYDLRIYSVFSRSEFHFYGPTRPTSARPPLERWARELLALFDTGCGEGHLSQERNLPR